VTRKAAVLFAATSVIWGSSFLFIRVAVEHLPPSVVVFGRTALGTAFLVPLVHQEPRVPGAAPRRRAGARGDRARHGPAHVPHRLGRGVGYWLFYLLIDEAGAATASVITYVMPVVALFLGVGLLGDRLTAGAVAGLILIAIGAWLATGPSRVSATQAGGGDAHDR
jgi:drug/metabolite transporter (DMT)-like permease